nr:hypothetical protein L203_02380 [Cryptococcus depauperatus CBS 7841]
MLQKILLYALLLGEARGIALTSPSKTLQPFQPYRTLTLSPLFNHTTSRDAGALERRAKTVEETRMYSQRELAMWKREDRRALDWVLQIAYEGQTFFNGWDWFTETDPSHGLVNYVDASTAFSKGLAFWTKDGVPGIQVDHFQKTAVGGKRDSVRITTKSLFQGGLFIIDMALMPWGCGVWPAFWTLGYEGNWPETGEIDIVEGVQAMTNKIRAEIGRHTTAGCALDDSTNSMYTGSLANRNCDSSKGGSGCSIVSDSASSFGMPFNAAGGGSFAMLWDNDGIKMWNWNRAAIPSDIAGEKPNPNAWGKPVAVWDKSICNIDSYFKSQVLILNINICGDWIWNTYKFSYCPGTCQDYVADPSNLNNTIMLVNYVKVFQQAGRAAITQQAENVQNLTGAGGPVAKNGVRKSRQIDVITGICMGFCLFMASWLL